MRLYNFSLSGNCYKVRLLCALLNVPIEIEKVDLAKGGHKQTAFLDLNPFGQVPVFEDGDLVLRDSQAILVYLARKHGGDDWLPTDPEGLARVVQWLATAANEVARGPNDARLHDKFGYKLDVEAARSKAHGLFKLFEAHLATRDWLELGRPTVADVACYPYLALAPEGGVPLEAYPAVRAWMCRIRTLPGYLAMPGQYVEA